MITDLPTLEVKNGELTWGILGNILDSHQKGLILREVALKENILPEQVIAVGDGDNDLEMHPVPVWELLSMPKVFYGNVLPVTLMHCSIL